MSILLAVIGATIGAVIGSLFMHWRNDVAKERQQLESKTPYDYALTNAINERDRLQDELRTIQALKRTEADTERIRNEIDMILTDGGEEPTESVYEPNIGMPIRDNGDGTFSPITWDIRIGSEETAGSKPRIVTVSWVNEAEDGRYWHRTSGELNGSAWTNEGLSHVTVDNECIDGDKVDLITEGDDISGETLYRKGWEYQ